MELFFRKEGHPALPPLILLHGLWGASDNWLPVARLLSEHFFVLLPDCRNHGHSPHAPENNYPALVKDLEEFIDQLHLPVKPFLAGHSMGGKVIMHLLLRSPRIAAKAAILDICPKTYPSMEEHCRLATFMTRFPLSSAAKILAGTRFLVTSGRTAFLSRAYPLCERRGLPLHPAARR